MEVHLSINELVEQLKKAYKEDPCSLAIEAKKQGLFIFDEFSLANRDHIIYMDDTMEGPIDFQDIFDEENYFHE